MVLAQFDEPALNIRDPRRRLLARRWLGGLDAGRVVVRPRPQLRALGREGLRFGPAEAVVAGESLSR